MTLPLVPNAIAGSPDPNELVTVQAYRSYTKDTASTVNDVKEALADAIDQLCNECRRTFLYGQYTEDQYLYGNGMVYPSATPIDPTKPIFSNEQIYDPAVDNAPGSVIQGQGVWVGWFTPLPWMPVFTGVLPPQTNITYWGGYTQATCPPKLRRMFSKVAFYTLNGVGLIGQPAGVKSMSVGGVSISGDLSSFMESDPALKRAIRRWRHPQVSAWQS